MSPVCHGGRCASIRGHRKAHPKGLLQPDCRPKNDLAVRFTRFTSSELSRSLSNDVGQSQSADGNVFEGNQTRGLDGKVKATTAVALVVAGRVGVTKPSHEIACWRFFRKARQINTNSASPSL